MTQFADSVRDPAYEALVIRTDYRDRILNHKPDTYDTFVQDLYTADLEREDSLWVKSLQEGQTTFVNTPDIYVAGYSINAFVGLRIGSNPISDPLGLDYKIFLQMKDFLASLTWSRYVDFSKALSQRGFQGDSKIPLLPGQARYQYNNVIVHAPTVAMALCAEATAISFFGAEIDRMARGVDTGLLPGETPTDWHHALLKKQLNGLPTPVQDFLRYRTVATAGCPRPDNDRIAR
jgi:hypothetical protein